MNPADELRNAADKLRALATAASVDNDGTPTANWHTEPCGPDDAGYHHLYGDHLTRDDDRTESWPRLNRGGSLQRPSYMHGQHAEYAAAMGPTVGLTLADWLDFEADLITRVPGAELRDRTERALAVARAINGGQS
ncbi:hypothetical protein [Streptomyces luteogriseus]|uniref:hypothetical protein n=1 Tax=Streptomyces luteogriseus TaxID=68233 RepID=UPI003827ECDA